MNNVSSTISTFFKDYPVARYGKGQIILRPDDEVQKIMYLEDGHVVQYDISPAGNTIIVNIFKPRAFFPMSHALNRNENHYFYEAASPSSARLAPLEHVVEFLHQHQDVTLDLLSRVYRGTDGMQRRMAHLMGGTAKSRLVFELLNSAYRFGDVLPGGSAHLAITESDIAKRSGLSRETVSRAMKELKIDECVVVSRHGIDIPNLEKLESIIGTNL